MDIRQAVISLRKEARRLNELAKNDTNSNAGMMEILNSTARGYREAADFIEGKNPLARLENDINK